MGQIENHKDEEDEEDFCGWLDVVNSGGCVGGELCTCDLNV